MGCAASTEISEKQVHPAKNKIVKKQDSETRENDAIEQLLLQSQQREKNQIKLLLLGAGEGGKSTVLKQMRILHQGGFQYQERLKYSQIIWADTIASMQMLIIQARKLGIPLMCDQPNGPLTAYKRKVLSYKPLNSIDANLAGGMNFLKSYVAKYSSGGIAKRKQMSTGQADAGWDDSGNSIHSRSNSIDNSTIVDDDFETEVEEYVRDNNKYQQVNVPKAEIAEAIQKLWLEDEGIKQTFQKSNLFQLEGSASYFFDKVLEFSTEDYVCSDEDILKGRIKTTGITETSFNVNNFKVKLIDTGGQRSERQKWIHCFQGITAVIFVLAVSEYDQVLFEDERVNRMHESIMLFDSLCNSRWFVNTPFILFMNKIDLLPEKVRRSPLRKYFPDFQGKSNDAEDALKYFENLFLSLNRTRKPIYIHRTCATDEKSMKFVLTAMTDVIIQQNMKRSGLI